MLEVYQKEEKIESQYQMMLDNAKPGRDNLEDEGNIRGSSDEDQTYQTHSSPRPAELLLEEKEDLFQEMFLDKSLMKHLLEIEETARNFMEMERPRMMESLD